MLAPFQIFANFTPPSRQPTEFFKNQDTPPTEIKKYKRKKLDNGLFSPKAEK
jgi:hypothetical protein